MMAGHFVGCCGLEKGEKQTEDENARKLKDWDLVRERGRKCSPATKVRPLGCYIVNAGLTLKICNRSVGDSGEL